MRLALYMYMSYVSLRNAWGGGGGRATGGRRNMPCLNIGSATSPYVSQGVVGWCEGAG